MEQQPPVLEVRRVTKRFPGVLALNDISFGLRPGEAHALVGENGAGKSTLIKVITGVYRPDEGQILFEGEEVSFAEPRESQEAGISTIYQEVNLIPLLSVAENVFLGRQPRGRLGLIDRARMNRQAAEILDRYGIRADVTAPLRSLGLGAPQTGATARAALARAPGPRRHAAGRPRSLAPPGPRRPADGCHRAGHLGGRAGGHHGRAD